MADASFWSNRFSKTSYRFVRVSRATGNELETVPVIKGGTITRNNDTRIIESAEFSIVGALSVGADLIRVYAQFEAPGGETASEALGTFIPVVPSRSVKRGFSTATVNMYGRLQELYDDIDMPLTIPSGTNAVEYCRTVVEAAGLECVADASSYTTSRVRSYGAGVQTDDSDIGETKLDMINDLLGLAGFAQASTDPYGRVLLRKYVEPAERPSAWTFSEGANARFLAEMTDERDTTSTANHVIVVYSSDEETVIGEAWDTDPDSEFSTVSQGRTITKTYTYSDLPEGTEDERQAVADRKAANLLATAQAVIRRVSFTHMYCPVDITDAVTLDYPSGSVSGEFAIRTQTISLVAGCPVQCEARQFDRKAA